MQDVMDKARGLFSGLDAHWHGVKKGMHRPGYSYQESQAHEIIADSAGRELGGGIELFQDLAGNGYMVYPGKDRSKPAFMMGSHTDAVPNGGKYDGPLGVIGALSALFQLHAEGVRPPQDTVICNWRAEESPWFGQFAVGSHIATGRVGAGILDNTQREDGQTLRTHMQAIGLDVERLEQALQDNRPLLPSEQIAGFIEAHIEQDSELYDADIPLGVVHAIRGNIRFPGDFIFSGNGGHSGARPMHKRADAARAGNEMLYYCFGKADYLGACNDIVITAPYGVEIDNPQPTKIPDRARVGIEVRSLQPEILSYMQNHILKTAQKIAGKHGVIWENADTVQTNTTQPVTLTQAMIDRLGHSAHDLGINHMRIPSGAGHDASVLQQAGIPAAMIFQRHGNNGLSHDPCEIMTCREDSDPFAADSDFARTVRVMAETARQDHSPERNGGGRNDESAFLQALKQRGAMKI